MSLQNSPGALAPDRSAQGYLCADQLAKRFPGMDAPAVDEVSLAIHKGEIFALLGSSGCGKSTLLRMLAGFEKPTSGSVVLNGIDITGLAPHERPINMMFQSFALFPHLNTWDNIAFGLKREGMPKPQIQARVEEMLGLVQLESFATRKPHQLSGGQQQRVALARSLAKKPQLLLLDEPLGALDKKLRERTQFELVNILKSVGVTCVMVTHDQEEAMAMASRIAVMSHGRVLQVGTPREIYEQPKCRFVADFIGNVNMFEGVLTLAEAQSSEIRIAEGVVKLGRCIDGALGMDAAIALRPENISLSKARPAAIGSNLFSGRVSEIAYFGSYNSFIVEMSSGRRVKITELNNVRQDHDFITPDDAVYFWWDDRASMVLTR